MNLEQLGINPIDIIAGFCGGVVNAFVFKRTSPLSFIASVVVGTLTANYLGPVAATYVGTKAGAASFIVGLAGMAICQGIVEAARKWRPPLPPAGDAK